MTTLRDRLVATQHANGNHTDCPRESCEWYRRPAWIRLRDEGRLRAKELA